MITLAVAPIRHGFRQSWHRSTFKWIQSLSNAKYRHQYVSHRTQSSSAPANKPNTSIPSEADVVIIGGGALGCSTLYHLAKLGITNTVLLEAHKLTSGTTWHTAGMVWEMRYGDTETNIIYDTRKLILRLEKETGVNPGWISNGGLMIATSENCLNEYKRLMSHGRAVGIDTYILDPAETKKLYPLMNVDDIVGSLYSPRDGNVDPAGYCTALTRYASKAGAKIIENCPVTNIRTNETLFGGQKVTEVHTPHGIIKTNNIVNASGAWGNVIANMVGLELPLMVLEHGYVVTEKIPGIENMPNVRERSASGYLKLQGDALTIGGFESDPVIINKLAKDSPFMLFDFNWDVFSSILEGCGKRVPIVQNTGIKSTVSGPESFTPDHKAIMGEDPNVQGFFHCTGFNSSGMTLSGGCGDQMAKWVANGRPEYDMFAYDIRRFYAPLFSNKSWIIEKSHEAYAKRYSIHYHHDEPLAGRGQRLSPLHEVLENQGCVFQERHGWERPGWFNNSPTPIQPYDWYGSFNKPLNTDQKYRDALKLDYTFGFPEHHKLLQDECLACRNKAAIFDLSHFGKFYLTGPDAQKAADWLFTANVEKDPGTTIYTCMLNDRGGVEADLTVTICSGEHVIPGEPTFKGRGFYLTTGGPAALQNLTHVQKEMRSHNWDVDISTKTEDMAMLSLQGPQSRNILQTLSDSNFNNDAFPISTHSIITVAGHKVRAIRLSFVGEMGWELHMPNSSAVAVYRAIMEAGKNFGIVNAGYRALDSLSCEKGYRHWHADLRSDDTPLEAGLEFTCKIKSNTNFLGREALEQQKLKGVHKKLITFILEDPTKLLLDCEGIWRNGKPVGLLRRAEYAYTLGRSIGFGYVKENKSEITKEFLETGTWEIESMGERLKATAHFRSPFDPKNLRVKGHYENNILYSKIGQV